MNITANNVASKLFVGFVATAMLFMLATPAKAQTAEELQAQINALMAQIAALQGATTPSATTCTFTRSLTVGSQGEDVKCLQTALTPTYFKNAGGATGYFGPVTAAAVAAWQSANGVTPAVGYFGPISQAKFAMTAPAPTPTPTTPGSDDSGDNTTSANLSGEASLDKAEISSADDDTIDEGQEDATIAEFKVKFVDGDAQITRLDLTLTSSDLVENDPWNTFENLSIEVDGETVATKDISSKSDYLDDNAGTLRVSGLNIVAKEDKDVTIKVLATVQNSVDGSDDGNDWNVSVDSMRFIDGTDVTSTEESGNDFGNTVAFTVGSAGGDDELIVKTSQSDPDGTTFHLKDDQKSDWETAFAFDLDTKDSQNDIELNDIYVTVEHTSGVAYNTLVDDAELVIDGVTIDDVTVTDGASTTAAAVLHFNVDGDAKIDAGDRVAAELKLRFKSLLLANEGKQVRGSVTGAQAEMIDATGGDDLGTSQLSGAATGDWQTLRTKGAAVTVNDISSSITSVDNANNDYAVYTVKVDVEAFDQDIYLSNVPATSTGWSLVDGAGASAITGTSRVVVLSSSDESNDDTVGFFKIPEGETETLTLKVTYTPGAAASARLKLNTLNFAETPIAPNQTWTASPASDYQTDVESIVG